MKDDLILQTKLMPPQLKGMLLRRERLLNLLKENLDKKLVLICADAGYGKTTLLAQFCEQLDRPFVFYDLDTSDNDLSIFFNYITAGIQLRRADFGGRIKGIIPQTRNIEILVGTFINEFMEKIKGEFYVILDDYHNLQQNKEIGNALDYLLRHLPANLHFIISSRSTPALNLAYYLAKQELFGLAKQQLQFNLKEIQELLKGIYGLKISDKEISRIELHSEGWITAIQLILQKISASGEEKAKETLNGYIASGEEVFNYFAREIFGTLPKDIQEFLMKTSIFEYLKPEICEKVLDVKNASPVLKYLLEEHLFITSVNKEFRYHPIFREFLVECFEDTFGQGEIRRLNEKAGAYFEINKEPLKATKYFLAAKRFKKAAKLIEMQASEMILHGQINQFNEWVKQIPENIIQKHPWLLVYKAGVYIILGKWDESFDILNTAEKIFRAKNNKRGEAEVLYSKGVILFRLGKLRKTLEVSKKAIKLLKSKETLLRAKILHTIGWIKSNAGEYREAEVCFQKGLSICRKIKDKTFEVQLINASAVSAHRQADLNKALEYYESLINHAEQEVILPSNLANIYGNAASVYIEHRDYKKALNLIDKAEDLANKYNDQRSLLYLTGVRGKFYLEQNDLDKAIDYFKKALALNQKFGEKRISIFSLYDLSTAFKGKGDYIKSEEYLNKAGEIIKEKRGTVYLHYLFLKAELKSILRDFAAAEQIFKEVIKLAKEIKGYKYIFKAYFFLAQRNMQKAKKKLALEYLVQAISLSRRHNADNFFMQEFKNNANLFKFMFDKGIEKRYLTRLLRKIHNPEAQALLEEVGKKPLVKERIFDLKIDFFDGLKIKKSNGEIIEPNWLTKKTKSLLGYLIVNRKSRCQREVLIDNFWPDAGVKEARHNLQMSISFIRKLLYKILNGRFNKKAIIVYKNNKYSLNQNIIFKVDAEEFDEVISYAATVEKREREKSLQVYKKALEIYKGDYCTDVYDQWCEQKRIYYRELCCKLLKRMAEIHFDDKNYEASLDFYRRALFFNKFDESIHCGIMQNFAALGNSKAVAEQYENLKKILKDELETPPSQGTTKLFQTLISQSYN